MSKDMGYESVMSPERKKEILKNSTGINYEKYEYPNLGFDYEALMREEVEHSLEEIREIYDEVGIGSTPLVRLDNLTELARRISPEGKGAEIYVKDERNNPSGSFKDRRAGLNVYMASQEDYDGVACASSGNYGAAVASQAAKRGLKSIVLQEAFDSEGIGQPEILEKGRACSAYGAEVLQLTVGPELFYYQLRTLEETGFFNASLYTPYAIAGVETLGYEIALDMKEKTGEEPDLVLVTTASGGNITGTERGLRKAGCDDTEVYAVSVNLGDLHMASDKDFNRKYFTTGHTGFGVPFALNPDRSDVPFNAARSLRHMDGYLTVEQGEVFYITEALAQLEGIERGPAGNTSLAAAVAVAMELDKDKRIVVNETEYTGAGKHPTAQLTFAREMGMQIVRGDPKDNEPGRKIVIPKHPEQISPGEIDLEQIRKRYLEKRTEDVEEIKREELDFLVNDTNSNETFVRENLPESLKSSL